MTHSSSHEEKHELLARERSLAKGAKAVKIVVSNARTMPSTRSNARMRQRLPSQRLNQPLLPW